MSFLRDQDIQDRFNDFHRLDYPFPLEPNSKTHAAGLSARSSSLKNPKLPLTFKVSARSLQQPNSLERQKRSREETIQNDALYYQLGRPLSVSVPNFKIYDQEKEKPRARERLAVQTKFPEGFFEDSSYGEIDDLFALYEDDSGSDLVSSPACASSIAALSPAPSRISIPFSIQALSGTSSTAPTRVSQQPERISDLESARKLISDQLKNSLVNSTLDRINDASLTQHMNRFRDDIIAEESLSEQIPLIGDGVASAITDIVGPLFYEPPVFMSVSPNSERDQYGFRKQTAHVTRKEYDSWHRDYQLRVRERKKKWDGLLRENGIVAGSFIAKFPPKNSKGTMLLRRVCGLPSVVRRYIRKGIPPEYRGAAWFFYAGGPAKLAAHPGLYKSLVIQSSSLHTTDSEIIERDLHRTFPDCALFRPPECRDSKLIETPIIQALRRVLRAFAYYCPRVGYCQSINFITGILLLFMDEERAFWMLFITTQEYLPGVHDVNLEGANVDQAVLCMLIKETQPAIWSKLGGGLEDPNAQTIEDIAVTPPPVTLVTASWFMSMFCGILPWETLLRVWDCFFLEGSKILFKVALTIFKHGEQEILAVTEPTMIFQVVQALPKRLINAGELLEACFRRRSPLGDPITQRQVDQKRRQVSARRQQVQVSKLGHGDSKIRSKSAVRGG
ncbi:GTPase-activating protein gyp3 [Neolecta irregularis DAH-3]|uniref:GTPase-activating protein gyp3 n=1 Tax=Neolecta irregularis (strain DAH-3) TaxID=1198029 RepID=A0A1U7LUG7_NEOID|nr:GTPase-activating protein gyp3 [Neolecta irregularis DAH-3]|eukprot:OLL26269.1 GTPase-activating protein gyp3 [Neolecta irregularis DAH-3]